MAASVTRIAAPPLPPPIAVLQKHQFVVVFGASTRTFQLPSACLPHTTTYFAFVVSGFPFLSLNVRE
jgi:hypothetical protein